MGPKRVNDFLAAARGQGLVLSSQGNAGTDLSDARLERADY
jgi:hypothetical protein